MTGKRDDKPDKYTKDFMKVRFESNDNLPLNKPKKFYVLTQIVSAFLKKTMSIIHNFFQINIFMSYKNATVSNDWCFRSNWSW